MELAAPKDSLEAVARCVPPHGLDFGYCSVGGHETTRTFVLHNAPPRGNPGAPVRFSLASDESYFSVSPDNGKRCLV